jgi:hypothetical protein
VCLFLAYLRPGIILTGRQNRSLRRGQRYECWGLKEAPLSEIWCAIWGCKRNNSTLNFDLRYKFVAKENFVVRGKWLCNLTIIIILNPSWFTVLLVIVVLLGTVWNGHWSSSNCVGDGRLHRVEICSDEAP